MENSKKLNENLGVNKIRKTIKKNPFQQTNDFGNNIITSGSYPYSMPKDEFYIVQKDEFKSFIQQITGKQSNAPNSQAQVTRLQKNRPPPLSIVRPPVRVQATTSVAPPQAPYNALHGHPLQPITDPHLVDSSQNNLVESPISAFMRNFQDYMRNYDNSTRSNQFQSYPPQSQVLNNSNVQSQPIIQSQQQHYPMSCNNQLVNCFHLSQANGSNQLVNGFAPSQTYVSNPLVSLNATNPNFPMNVSSQSVTCFPSSQITGPQSTTSEFLLPSPTNNMNLLSPQSPYRPPLSPNMFSLPSSPEHPFAPHLQNVILSPDPPSPLFAGVYPPFTNPKEAR